jgi:hypothetical protein
VEVEVAVARAYGGASMEKVVAIESVMVYRGPKLSYLVITLHVARSFRDKPNVSNSIKQELSVVKR